MRKNFALIAALLYTAGLIRSSVMIFAAIIITTSLTAAVII
jgi:hypothetical protein